MRKTTTRPLALALGATTLAAGFAFGPSSSPTRVARAEDPDVASADVADRPEFVTEKCARAIEKGVAWLAKNQKHSGELDESNGWGGSYSVAMTSLAGMAFLAHGDTMTQGKYARNVRDAVEYLLKVAKRGQPHGFIATPGERIHSHGFATMFLAECLGTDCDPSTETRIKEALHAAIDVTCKSQSDMGGWFYEPGQQGDEGSTTVTQVQALRACRNAGLAVPIKVIKNAVKYIEKSQCGDGGIAYTARNQAGGSRPAITAAAVAVLYDAGEYDSPMAKAALKYCKTHISAQDDSFGGGHYFYAHLYLSQANWQARGKHWEEYYPKIRDTLCARQDSSGSWEGDGVGRVYGTAIATTILAIPYEHVPIYAR